MKKSTTTYVAIAAVVLFVVLLFNFWSPFHTGNMMVSWDGDTWDGPIGAIVGTLMGGLGLLIGLAALAFALAVLGLIVTGLGMALVTVFAVGLLLAGALAVPFTLPLLIPVAIIWFFVSRARKQRLSAHAV